MTETTFEVRVPTSLLQFGFDQREIQHRITEWLVLSLFSEGHVSSGKAAQLLNITRIEFLALLRTRGIAYINYTPNELAEEFAAAKALEVKTIRGQSLQDNTAKRKKA
jgi:predicted HTH domain antitoxin